MNDYLFALILWQSSLDPPDLKNSFFIISSILIEKKLIS